jgi:hypothetical protein
MVALSVKNIVCDSRESHTWNSNAIMNTYIHKMENEIQSLSVDITHYEFQIKCKRAR